MDNIYKTILEDAPAGFYDWDICANTQKYSESYKKMFGFSDDDFAPTSKFYELLLDEDKKKAGDKYNEHVTTLGRVPYDIELRYRHHNGSIIWLRSTGRIIEWGPDNEPLRMVGCHIDITRQKKIEEQLRKTEALLNETGQVALVGGWEVDLVNHKMTWSKITKQIVEVPDDYDPWFDPLTGSGMKYIKEGVHRDNALNAMREAIMYGKSADIEIEMVTAKGNEKWIRAIAHAEFKNEVCIRIYGTYQDIDSQKRIQEDLAISEAQFRGAFEHSGFGMVIASPETKILKVNKRFLKMIGYTEQELIGMYTSDITHPGDQADTREMMEMFATNKVENYLIEKRYVNKKGNVLWCQVSVSVVKDAAGNISHFVGQYNDITQRKKAEDDLKMVNSEITALLRSSTQVAIISTDVNGIVKHFNRGAERMLGYLAKDVVDKTTSAIFYTTSEILKRGEEVSAKYKKEIRGFDICVTEVRLNGYETRESVYVRKDGSSFPAQVTVSTVLAENDDITGFLYMAVDISNIKRVENELRESEQRWQFALEGTGDGLWDMNLLTNTSYHSKECKAMVGYLDDDPLIARSDWESKIHPDDREKHDTDLELYLAGKVPVYVNEHRARCKDGSYKWILDRGKIIEWDESGKPVRMIGTHSDISERKEREQQQKNTLALISEQNNRLLNFAHIVSHNLRSHSGNFQMLLDMFADPETSVDEKEELLNHLKSVSGKLNDTITNLNEVVTIQTTIKHQKATLNLNEYVSQTIEVLAADISKHKVCIKNKVNTAYQIEYNPAYLESILLNLITNGIKYRNPETVPNILIDCLKQNGHDVLLIADNGLGIDLARQGDKLFGMYKTFHGNKDARGIGLFITKNQVEAMGGRIDVESEVGKGTTFKIWLT